MSSLLAFAAAAQTPPAAGKPEILPLAAVQRGMQATAWTTFEGVTPEPVPVEILGVMRNAWGPRQDIILAKLGGRAARTNVAGGMSGSPVYHEGRLLGAISLRFSVFSPDAIAGITPIELMLEIDEFDRSRPITARTALDREFVSENLAEQVWQAALEPPLAASDQPQPIETPLAISGAAAGVVELFSHFFRRQGVETVQAGALAARTLLRGDTAGALRPGEPLAAVLMAGDLSATALGTVSYNDGHKVLGFGHAMFNAGPIEAPIATADILHVLASQFSPFKIGNAATVVGALRQDRHSGILGELGATARMTPVDVRVRTFDADQTTVSQKTFQYEVLRNEKWTPQLLLLALFNSTFGLNDFADETTFRLSADLDFGGEGRRLSFETMQTDSQGPIPTPLLLAGSVVTRLQKVFTNVRDTPALERVSVSIDLLRERREALIDQVWVERRRVRPGDSLQGRIVLQPYRGARFERPFVLDVPAGAPQGRLTLLVSDASSTNQRQRLVSARQRSMTLSETVSLLNQELRNDTVYISLLDRKSPTGHFEDHALPSLPLTALSVLRPAAQGRLSIETQSPLAQQTLPLDAIVRGARALSIEVE